MKLRNREEAVQRGGTSISDEQDFGIIAGPKAYSILSDKLYSNKVRAVIRETSTNALDAHNMNDCKLPIKVHLPNQLELYYTVRDFGPGIHPDNINEIYCVYFNSTKTDSNRDNGALGLGCKSPFAYNSSFIVTVWFGGKKRLYEMYMEQGTPKNQLKIEVDCDPEETGVEVKVPVRDTDISTFKNEAEFVYAFFENKPTISGVRDINIPNLEVQGNYSTIKNVNGYGSKFTSRVYARMANVGYPIPEEFYEKLLFKLVVSSTNGVVVLDFDNGDLDFQPSREALSFDEITTNFIKNRMEKSSVELKDKLDDLYKRVKGMHPIDVYPIISKELGNSSSLYKHFVHCKDYLFELVGVKKPNKTSDTYYNMNQHINGEHWFPQYEKDVPNGNGTSAKRVFPLNGGKLPNSFDEKLTQRNKFGGGWQFKRLGTNDMWPYLHVVHVDKASNWRQKAAIIKDKIKKKYPSAYIIFSKDDLDLTKKTIIPKAEETLKDVFFYSTSDVTTQELKDFKQSVGISTTTFKRPLSTRVYDQNGWKFMNIWSADEVDELEGLYGVYYFDDLFYTEDAKLRERLNEGTLSAFLEAIDYKKSVYGLRKQSLKRADKSDNLQSVRSFVVDYAKEMSIKAPEEKISSSNAFKQISKAFKSAVGSLVNVTASNLMTNTISNTLFSTELSEFKDKVIFTNRSKTELVLSLIRDMKEMGSVYNKIEQNYNKSISELENKIYKKSLDFFMENPGLTLGIHYGSWYDHSELRKFVKEYIKIKDMK